MPSLGRPASSHRRGPVGEPAPGAPAGAVGWARAELRSRPQPPSREPGTTRRWPLMRPVTRRAGAASPRGHGQPRRASRAMVRAAGRPSRARRRQVGPRDAGRRRAVRPPGHRPQRGGRLAPAEPARAPAQAARRPRWLPGLRRPSASAPRPPRTPALPPDSLRRAAAVVRSAAVAGQPAGQVSPRAVGPEARDSPQRPCRRRSAPGLRARRRPFAWREPRAHRPRRRAAVSAPGGRRGGRAGRLEPAAGRAPPQRS
jgi:hypothetical protein